jgi:hypothetical protein
MQSVGGVKIMALASPLRKLAKPGFSALDNPYVENPLANLPQGAPDDNESKEPAPDNEAPEEDEAYKPIGPLASLSSDVNNPPDSADDTAPPQPSTSGTATDTPDNPLSSLSNDKQYPTPLLDRLKKMYLEEAPNPDDYKPSLGRRILAGIAAGSGASAGGISGGQMVGFKDDVKEGIAARNEVLEGPFNRASKRFDDRARGLTKAAEVEEKQVGNYRTADQRAREDTLKRDALNNAIQKNANIYETKIMEIQRKTDEFEKHADFLERQLASQQFNAQLRQEAQDARDKANAASRQAIIDISALREERLKHEGQLRDEDRDKHETYLESILKQKGIPFVSRTTVTARDAQGNPAGSRTTDTVKEPRDMGGENDPLKVR